MTRYQAVFGLALLSAIGAHTASAQWLEAQKLTPPDLDALDRFGSRIVMEGDMAAVSSPYDDDHGEDSGAVYIFERSAGEWGQTRKLVPTSTDDFVQFGLGLAIDGDLMMVGSIDRQGTRWTYVFEFAEGAWIEAERIPWASSITSLDGGVFVCGTRVYERFFGLWLHSSTLELPPQWSGGGSGGSVAVDGDMIVYGTAANFGEGAAWFYKRKQDGTWPRYGGMLGSGRNNNYGEAVGLNGTEIFVGVRGNPEYNHKGGVQVFSRATRQFLTSFGASDGVARKAFGASIAVDGDTLIIGAPGHDGPNQYQGSAYVFRGAGDQWTEVAKLSPASAEEHDSIGRAVAISGSAVLVSALGDDDRGDSAGAVYVFVEDACEPDFDGDGTLNTADLIAFLAAWSAHDPAADWNADGAIDTRDCVAYLQSWSAGCP